MAAPAERDGSRAPDASLSFDCTWEGDHELLFLAGHRVTEYALGERTVRAGDVYTTNCAWDNDTDHELTFPEEMCVTFGMAFPTEVPLVCDPD